MQQVGRSLRIVLFHQLRGPADLPIDVVKPQLSGLMRRLKKRLVRIDQLVLRLLQLEKLGNADVTLVIGGTSALEDGAGVCAHDSILDFRFWILDFVLDFWFWKCKIQNPKSKIVRPARGCARASSSWLPGTSWSSMRVRSPAAPAPRS